MSNRTETYAKDLTTIPEPLDLAVSLPIDIA
jgi:hypothetical protein